jgi:hypothetical protein
VDAPSLAAQAGRLTAASNPDKPFINDQSELFPQLWPRVPIVKRIVAGKRSPCHPVRGVQSTISIGRAGCGTRSWKIEMPTFQEDVQAHSIALQAAVCVLLQTAARQSGDAENFLHTALERGLEAIDEMKVRPIPEGKRLVFSESAKARYTVLISDIQP